MKYRKKPVVIEAYQFHGPTSMASFPIEFGNAVFPESGSKDLEKAAWYVNREIQKRTKK